MINGQQIQSNNRRNEKSKCTIYCHWSKPLSLWLNIYITFLRRRIVATIAFLRHLIPYHVTSIFRRGHCHVFFCFHSLVLCTSVLKPYFHLQNGKKFLDFCAKLVVLKLLLQFPVTRVLVSDQYLLCFMLCQIRYLNTIHIFFSEFYNVLCILFGFFCVVKLLNIYI